MPDSNASTSSEGPSSATTFDAYTFQHPALLNEALTHRAAGRRPSNERLEFLGDAVLKLVSTEYVMRELGDQQEGRLSQARGALVSRPSLRDAGEKLGIPTLIDCGPEGPGSDDIRSSDAAIADALEAVIGAVFLDGGLVAASRFVNDCVLIGNEAINRGRDHQVELAMQASRLGLLRPSYALRPTGPEHRRTFDATVTLSNGLQFTGSGPTRSAARSDAAAAALTALLTTGGEDFIE